MKLLMSCGKLSKASVLAVLPVALMIISPAFASTPTMDPSSLYGEPVEKFEQDGMRITVHEAGELKVVAVSSVNPPKCLFLSYTKPAAEYSQTEVAGFLQQFSAAAGAEWQVMDRTVVDNNLRFFLTAPKHAKAEFEERIAATTGDPSAVRRSWTALAENEQAHVEARALLNVLESQRQIWISSDNRFLACWSSDGRSFGVGFLPQTR